MNSSVFSSSSQAAKDEDAISGVKALLLPDKCFAKRAACTWRRGNQFSVYPRSQTVDQTGADSCENKIMHIRLDILLFSPILRKLVNESNGTFISIQKAAETAKNSDSQVELLKLSRQYRSILRVCIENLQDASTKATDGIVKNNFLSQITIFYSIECIWHLCEILFIDNIPGDVVLPFLLEWVRFHSPCHEQTAAQLLEACERGSETHPQFWDTVVGMVVQGCVDVARALLKLHSAVDSNEFKLVDNSLRSIPVYNVYGGVSKGEFTISWKHWQAECRSKLTSRSLASQPNLELILKLIIGDYAAFESIRDKFDSWFDLLGGWVMFTAPWSKKHELSVAASACAGMRTRRAHGSALDSLVRALTEGDLHQVISEVQQMSDGGWFATHLTDILYHCDKLKIMDKHQVNVTHLLRESLILEYGSLLTDHPSLWPVGLSYLACAPGEGRRRAELMLERVPVRSAAKALRVVAEARRHGLLSVARSISGVQSARHLSAARTGGALAWAIRARSSTLAARAADAALRRYVGCGVLPARDLLLTIGPNMLLSDRTVFLSKYCEFHRLYKNREFKNAGKLLVSLLTSKITPDYFWETLLLDTLPLLESDTPVLSSEATCEGMATLAARAGALCGERAELLRLALARNLAKVALAPPEEESSA